MRSEVPNSEMPKTPELATLQALQRSYATASEHDYTQVVSLTSSLVNGGAAPGAF
jgi:hypothetical protein